MITLVEESNASTGLRQGSRLRMNGTVDLIILFVQLNLFASQRTRIVSDVWGCLIRNEPVEAWLAWVGNRHIRSWLLVLREWVRNWLWLLRECVRETVLLRLSLLSL